MGYWEQSLEKEENFVRKISPGVINRHKSLQTVNQGDKLHDYEGDNYMINRSIIT